MELTALINYIKCKLHKLNNEWNINKNKNNYYKTFSFQISNFHMNTIFVNIDNNRIVGCSKLYSILYSREIVFKSLLFFKGTTAIILSAYYQFAYPSIKKIF